MYRIAAALCLVAGTASAQYWTPTDIWRESDQRFREQQQQSEMYRIQTEMDNRQRTLELKQDQLRRDMMQLQTYPLNTQPFMR